MGWKEDDVDVACQCWATQWVQAFGNAPDQAFRFIGPLGCTLSRVQVFHDGAASNTERARHFPEVFFQSGLAVAIILQAMSLSGREMIYRHYIERCWQPHIVIDRGSPKQEMARLKHPLRQALIAERMGIGVQDYYHRRDIAKNCIRAGLYPEKPLPS